ncbi:MAG: tRNA (guanine(26)-N(2))-dimethyltransferase [Candidatus Thermoplasmatota archaeon]|nr:tRNA (guanine(26)-N(2))-dimethyltransferase [Candidatus Thermoplasmatota archaeon]
MTVREGPTKLMVDSTGRRGPGRRGAAFYNPAMAPDRDLCVLFGHYAARQGCRNFLDGLAATGVRGIRLAHEVDGDIRVTLCEVNPASFELIGRQAALNGVEVEAVNRDVRILLHGRRFDYVDIDPYGSPAPYVPAALAGLKRHGFAAFTATDKATLCGVHPEACRRRYHAVGRRGPAMKEVGLRILTGYLVREAAGRDLGATPVFAYSHDHYFRVYLHLREGARRADRALQQVGWAGWDREGWRLARFDDRRPANWLGPLWTGPLQDKKAVSFMAGKAGECNLARPREVRRLLHLVGDEVDAPPLYYRAGALCKSLGIPQPPLGEVLDSLRQRGYRAVRTHCDPDALKTDAPLEAVEEIFVELST